MKLCQGDAFTLTMCLVPFSLVAGRDWLQGTGHGEGNPGRDPPNIRAGRANISGASHLDHSTCRSTGYRIGRATPLGPTGRRSVPIQAHTLPLHRKRFLIWYMSCVASPHE